MSASPPPKSPTSSLLKRPRTEDGNDVDPLSNPTKLSQLHGTPNSSGLATPMTVQSTQELSMESSAAAAAAAAALQPPFASSSDPTASAPLAAATSQKHTIPASNPPTKRRKITPEEKAQKAAEKEAERIRKEAEREAEKAKREAEREAEKAKKEAEREAKKAEAKAKKDEEERKKAERAKAREDEKRAAAEAKAAIAKAKEEEKLRKEKAQPRLNFFGFKLGGSTPPARLAEGKTLKASASPVRRPFITKDEARRRSMSVSLEPQSPSPAMAALSSAPKAAADETEQTKAYKKHFLPFHVLKYTTVAPHTKFSAKQIAESEDTLNAYLTSDHKYEPAWPVELHEDKVTRGYQAVPIKEILSQLQGSANAPVDLTEEDLNKHIDLSKQITMKYFDFSQDVRPPYSGTWTRAQSLAQARHLARNPFSTVLPDVDYEYDSEAEWDAGDGEDVDSDDEEEEVDDVEDDMDDFLDDEGAELAKAKKGLINTDLEPICSGLHWEDADGVLRPADGNEIVSNFPELKMEFLLEPHPQTVDPFTTIYWDPTPSSTSQVKDKSGLMQPPARIPLKDRPGFANGANIPQTVGGVIPKAVKVTSRKAAPAKVAPEYVAALKQYVDGRPDTKTGMLLNLKVKFSELTQAQIAQTLDEVAVRVGKVRKDQKWVLRENLP